MRLVRRMSRASRTSRIRTSACRLFRLGRAHIAIIGAIAVRGAIAFADDTFFVTTVVWSVWNLTLALRAERVTALITVRGGLSSEKFIEGRIKVCEHHAVSIALGVRIGAGSAAGRCGCVCRVRSHKGHKGLDTWTVAPPFLISIVDWVASFVTGVVNVASVGSVRSGRRGRRGGDSIALGRGPQPRWSCLRLRDLRPTTEPLATRAGRRGVKLHHIRCARIGEGEGARGRRAQSINRCRCCRGERRERR